MIKVTREDLIVDFLFCYRSIAMPMATMRDLAGRETRSNIETHIFRGDKGSIQDSILDRLQSTLWIANYESTGQCMHSLNG